MDMNMTNMDMDMSNSSMNGTGGMDMDMDGMDMMKMYFYFGYICTILFKGWSAKTAGTMLASCFGIGAVAFFYEVLKWFREDLQKRTNNMELEVSTCCQKIFNGPHLAQTVLHVIQLIVGYLLMLVVMTYNMYLCIAIVVGSALGYFLSGIRSSTNMDNAEHCH